MASRRTERTREDRVDRYAVAVWIGVGQLKGGLAISAVRVEHSKVRPFGQHDFRVPVERHENSMTIVAGHRCGLVPGDTDDVEGVMTAAWGTVAARSEHGM